MQMPVSRLFAVSVREVVPLLAARSLSYTFGEQGSDWCTAQAPALACSLHRLYLCALGLLSQGFLAFHAVARSQKLGGCMLRLRVGGTGRLGADTQMLHALDRMGFVVDVDASGRAGQPRLQRAHGLCPASQARIEFACLPLAGFLFSAAYPLRDAQREPEPPPASGHPRLWLLQGDPVNAASVASQAQARGWAVTTLPTLDDALRRVRAQRPGQAWPALVIAFEGPGLSVLALQRLRLLLPERVHCVLAVEAGSPWLLHPQTLPGFVLGCHPFSRGDWNRWTQALAGSADAPSGGTRPAPLTTADRLPVLVATPQPALRTLARTMLDALGYEVHLAADGPQALQACQQRAPVLALLDFQLPVLDGCEATRRLRELQRHGHAPPCRVLLLAHAEGASAEADTLSTDALWRAQQAGADGCLPGPLQPDTLQAELARWCATRREPDLLQACA